MHYATITTITTITTISTSTSTTTTATTTTANSRGRGRSPRPPSSLSGSLLPSLGRGLCAGPVRLVSAGAPALAAPCARGRGCSRPWVRSPPPRLCPPSSGMGRAGGGAGASALPLLAFAYGSLCGAVVLVSFPGGARLPVVSSVGVASSLCWGQRIAASGYVTRRLLFFGAVESRASATLCRRYPAVITKSRQPHIVGPCFMRTIPCAQWYLC